MASESKNDRAVVTRDGTVYRLADPTFHPYGIPRIVCSLSCAVLTVVEMPPLCVTMRVITSGDMVTIGTTVGMGVGPVPIMGE